MTSFSELKRNYLWDMLPSVLCCTLLHIQTRCCNYNISNSEEADAAERNFVSMIQIKLLAQTCLGLELRSGVGLACFTDHICFFVSGGLQLLSSQSFHRYV